MNTNLQLQLQNCISFLIILIYLIPNGTTFNIHNKNRVTNMRLHLIANSEPIAVMINGLPGPMALETAKVCVKRGHFVVPIAFTGSRTVETEIVIQDTDDNGNVSNSSAVKLIRGPGINEDASQTLKNLKQDYPNMIIVDYTSPSAAISNFACYVESNCDFVMGTTGADMDALVNSFQSGANYAVIAPNMAKQIVAMQAALQAVAQRFPNSFESYSLTVKESHQSSKVDTSGTAKAVVGHLSDLIGSPFDFQSIEKIRTTDEQLAFGVPENALKGHAFHTYQLKSPDNSVVFELQHNVCGRRIYAEGTVDAVQFIRKLQLHRPERRLYNMIDVLEAGMT